MATPISRQMLVSWLCSSVSSVFSAGLRMPAYACRGTEHQVSKRIHNGVPVGWQESGRGELFDDTWTVDVVPGFEAATVVDRRLNRSKLVVNIDRTCAFFCTRRVAVSLPGSLCPHARRCGFGVDVQ